MEVNCLLHGVVTNIKGDKQEALSPMLSDLQRSVRISCCYCCYKVVMIRKFGQNYTSSLNQKCPGFGFSYWNTFLTNAGEVNHEALSYSTLERKKYFKGN